MTDFASDLITTAVPFRAFEGLLGQGARAEAEVREYGSIPERGEFPGDAVPSLSLLQNCCNQTPLDNDFGLLKVYLIFQ